jgi:hypothetical protein
LNLAEHRYERNPDFVFRKIVDEMILVPIRADVADMECIYTLNEVGAFIWDRLDGQATLAEIQVAVQDEYEADAETIAADVVAFVQDLDGVGAIRRI